MCYEGLVIWYEIRKSKIDYFGRAIISEFFVYNLMTYPGYPLYMKCRINSFVIKCDGALSWSKML